MLNSSGYTSVDCGPVATSISSGGNIAPMIPPHPPSAYVLKRENGAPQLGA